MINNAERDAIKFTSAVMFWVLDWWDYVHGVRG